MPLGARRTFRFGAVVALSLVLAYGLATPMPFLAPIFAVLLTAAPAPPMGPKQLLGLLLVVAITLGIGLVLMPLLRIYPISAVMMIAAGLFASTYLGVGKGKAMVGTLLTIGLTMIPAAGLLDIALARTVVKGLLIGIGMVVVCQWIVYPLFPEDPVSAAPPKAPPADPRTAGVARPAHHADRVAVGDAGVHQSVAVHAADHEVGDAGTAGLSGHRTRGRVRTARFHVPGRRSSRSRSGSLLKFWPSLWMFGLWMLLFGVYFGAQALSRHRHAFPGFVLGQRGRDDADPARPRGPGQRRQRSIQRRSSGAFPCSSWSRCTRGSRSCCWSGCASALSSRSVRAT